MDHSWSWVLEILSLVCEAVRHVLPNFHLVHEDCCAAFFSMDHSCSWVLEILSGTFIIYLRVPKEGRGLEKSLHTLTLGRGQTHSYVIFSKSIFYIRNRAVKWFGRDHISFI